MRGRTRRFALAVVCSASMGMLATPAASAAAGPGAIAGPVAAAEARTGHDIYRQFRDGVHDVDMHPTFEHHHYKWHWTE